MSAPEHIARVLELLLRRIETILETVKYQDRIKVSAHVENLQLTVSLSADTDSVLCYGQKPDGSIAPVPLTQDGKLDVNVTNTVSVTGVVSVDNLPTDYARDSTVQTVANRLYDSAEGKSITQIVKEIRDRTEWSYLTRLDITLSAHRDAIVSAIEAVQARYARLQIYDSTTGTWRDVADQLPVEVKADSVGLARESTLSTVADRLYDSAEAKSITQVVKEVRDRLPSTLTSSGNFKVAIAEDQVGVAKTSDIADLKNTLHADLYDSTTGKSAIAVLQSIDGKVATEATLSTVADRLYDADEGKSITTIVKEVREELSQPTTLKSRKIVKDNSSGSEDLVEPLFSTPTPSKSAVIARDINDTGTIYIGDANAQEFPFEAGDQIITKVSDLSTIYVRVPPGVVANLYVLWEV